VHKGLVLIHTVILCATGFFLGYTKFFYKRTLITESAERKRLAEQEEEMEELEPQVLVFPSMTLNTASYQRVRGKEKFHYVTLSFSLELEAEEGSHFDHLKSAFLDQVTAMIGKKESHELSSFQGRYLLRSALIAFANQWLSASHSSTVVKNLYFTEFLVK